MPERLRPSITVQYYLCGTYLTTVWLLSNLTVPFSAFNGIPVYAGLTLLMLLVLRTEVITYAALIFVVMLIYELFKSVQPGFVFTQKAFLGICAFSLIMAVNYFAVRALMSLPTKLIIRWLKWVLFAILTSILIADILGNLGYIESRYENYFLPIRIYSGVFSEPSHVALALAPFIFMLVYDIRSFGRQFGRDSIICIIVIFVLCHSATLFSITAFAGLVTLLSKVPRGNVLGVIVTAGLCVAVAVSMVLLPEVADRLNSLASGNSLDPSLRENVSALVFLKGQQMAEYGLLHFPLGVAFLNMEVLAPHSQVTYLDDTLMQLNSQDGSSLLFKGVSEFGVSFVLFAVFNVLTLARKAFRDSKPSVESLVLMSFQFTFLAHFIRAGSYFTGVASIAISLCIFEMIPRMKLSSLVPSHFRASITKPAKLD